MKLDGITSEKVSEYVSQREADGVEIGTINRELSVLRPRVAPGSRMEGSGAHSGRADGRRGTSAVSVL